MKYSAKFEESYAFYLRGIEKFDFCGTNQSEIKFQAIPNFSGRSAKECFFKIEAEGKNLPCKEPELLNQLLLCKASLNFYIKQWAEGRADGTLPLVEFCGDGQTIEWIDGEPIYYNSIVEQFDLPLWVIKAVELQKCNIILQDKNFSEFHNVVRQQKEFLKSNENLVSYINISKSEKN